MDSGVKTLTVQLYVETQAYEAHCERCGPVFSVSREYLVRSGFRAPFFVAHMCQPPAPDWSAV
ncbi:hypothetical protein FDI41_gp49 [Arthrobacter phage Piccoletto]|uniref:Uncharacterized protein n=1 Tax=Arthrobacter phage Piccoletto TaxID=2024282 RepID=A0A222Z9E0_9CAUD|nr:hypothetical protein FDI41_gp49 [Arthrobacter phage Piccoletto]ASR80680.1 hypothetical protein SEA_PICCOLETTO_49 [Arthrobacter phage Piccoletto]